jgi:hypothetical protein
MQTWHCELIFRSLRECHHKLLKKAMNFRRIQRYELLNYEPHRLDPTTPIAVLAPVSILLEYVLRTNNPPFAMKLRRMGHPDC